MLTAPWRAIPLRYNHTGSLPRGWYFLDTRDALQRGDLLHGCIPQRAADVALARGYAARGHCPGGTAPIGKRVAGLPGDTVHFSAHGIRIGKRMLKGSTPVAHDTRGRAVQAAAGTTILGRQQCVVLSTYSRKSFDSRYFGPVRCAPPYKVLHPLALPHP